MLNKLWLDQSGGIISTELVLVASLVTAGILGGMSKFSRNISDEFTELGKAVSSSRLNADDALISGKTQTELSGMEFYLLDESYLLTEDGARRDDLSD